MEEKYPRKGIANARDLIKGFSWGVQRPVSLKENEG